VSIYVAYYPHIEFLKAALNTAALNSEDRHRPLHTQAAALKLDLNDINMCLSMSPITGLSTHRSTLKTGTEHSGSQHSSTQRLSTLKIGTGLSTHCSTLKIGTGLSTHRQRLSNWI
jgi:hypothetical protein